MNVDTKLFHAYFERFYTCTRTRENNNAFFRTKNFQKSCPTVQQSNKTPQNGAVPALHYYIYYIDF